MSVTGETPIHHDDEPMHVRRGRPLPIVTIRIAALRDERLSREARGLLAELLTYQGGEDVSIDEADSAVQELLNVGYLIVHREPDGEASFSVYDEPEASR